MPIQMFAMRTDTIAHWGEVSQLIWFDARRSEASVDDAGLAVEHPRPDGGGHEERQQPRHQEEGAEGRARAGTSWKKKTASARPMVNWKSDRHER